jgi:hypothetical protein
MVMVFKTKIKEMRHLLQPRIRGICLRVKGQLLPAAMVSMD